MAVPSEPRTRRRFYLPVEAAGLDSGLTFHRLGHSAGYHMRETGEPLEVIQKRLGHASIRTTADVYGSLPVAVDKAASDRLNTMYESSRGHVAEMDEQVIGVGDAESSDQEECGWSKLKLSRTFFPILVPNGNRSSPQAIRSSRLRIASPFY